MSQGNVTVTASTTTTKVSPTIRFDSHYIKTLPGILKVAEAVTCLIGFICAQTISTYDYKSASNWYSFVSMFGFWVSLVMLVLYLFHIIEKLHGLPWLLAEIIFSAIWCVFFFIAACVAAAHGKSDPGWGAAAFFGFVAMVIFGVEAFFKYRKWRAGDIAQGERTTSSSNANENMPTPTGPSYPTY